MLETINALIEQNAAALWVLPALFLLATFDALLPPVPSDSVVITLAAFGAAHGSPHLLALGAVAAMGAFVGDNLTFTLARRSGLSGLRNSLRPKVRQTFRRAESELDRRGGPGHRRRALRPCGSGRGQRDCRRGLVLAPPIRPPVGGSRAELGGVLGRASERSRATGSRTTRCSEQWVASCSPAAWSWSSTGCCSALRVGAGLTAQPGDARRSSSRLRLARAAGSQ